MPLVVLVVLVVLVDRRPVAFVVVLLLEAHFLERVDGFHVAVLTLSAPRREPQWKGRSQPTRVDP